jgi:hypothetical protein
MKLSFILLLPLIAAAGGPAGALSADLSRVEAEPNLEKRAHAALDNAEDALKQAREAYAKGDNAESSARLDEVEQSVALADSSLKQTHKNPSRSPKHFKQAELRTRELLRKLDGFRNEMSVVDRPALDRVVAAVQKIHDSLLDGIMGGKRK